MGSVLSTTGSDKNETFENSYELELDQIIDHIRRNCLKRIGLQGPEGIKRSLLSLARTIKDKTGAEVIISGDPCYGACDIDLSLCKEVDLMLHLGHSELIGVHSKVTFIEARMKIDLSEVAEKAVRLLKSEKVVVSTTVQHVHKINQVLEILENHGIKGIVIEPKGRAKYPGQVLGCCYATVKSAVAQEQLFVGSGNFHPLGIAISTGMRVVAADPISGDVSEINPDRLLRRRFAAITKASEARRFAVLVSKKTGQKRMDLARSIKELGETEGKEMNLVYLDNIESDRLLNLDVDSAVSTACPRIALDDSAKYMIPILTPPEFEILVGKKKWEDYEFDEMI